jgi:ribosomal-protein-alanine N-acetyltransferase
MDWPASTSIEDVRTRIAARAPRWDAGAEFSWVMVEPGNDRAIGAISCFPEQHRAEIGFVLHRLCWGRGYATQAASAVTEWALSSPAVPRVWATCDCENASSIRVLEKLGFEREGRLRQWAVRPNLGTEPRDAFIYARVRQGKHGWG